MSQKNKNQINIKQSAVLYYLLRSLQRISLTCLGVAVAAVYASVVNVMLENNSYQTFKSIADLSTAQAANIDLTGRISILVGVLAVASVTLSVLMLIFPRVRKFQKQLVVDGVIVSATLTFLVVMVIPVTGWFLVHFL